eukprot:CAMPEP_0177693554 /NCGR_PEP_ID=MMETSP0484_2-20121128/2461_1 /TAXON_ID=354590 /ORGANISM="Rhodomonas lens, Strain RHODO" /LENGTH=798 /DNA_ID=CAMNT_0019204371 /DNA_START=60 /DNA_END=2457 /DNA_ORIENTATION=-
MATLDWLKELHQLGLLEKVWPWDRVVLGLRVCKWLRSDLQCPTIRGVLLASSCRCAGSKVEDICETLVHPSFNGKEVHVQWRGQGRVSTNALLHAVKGAAGAQRSVAILKITHLDLGHNDIEKHGSERLAEVLALQTTIQYLGLRGNCFSHVEASVLGQSLRLCRGLTHLDLGENQLGERGAAYLATCLRLCTALQHLDLTSNRVGTAGVELLVSGLVECKSFAHLGLADNNIFAPGANTLSVILRGCTSFQHLDLSRNRIHDTAEKLFVAVGQSVSLSHLDLHSNNIGDDGAAYLADVLGECESLSYLDLNDCRIGDGGLRNIASVLAVCKALAHLDLGRNDFGTLGCHILASQVAACARLAYFGLDAISDVTGSRVASDAIGALVSGLSNCQHLAHLALSRIELGAEGAARLAEWLGWLPLTNLDLAGNQIGDLGMSAVAKPLQRLTALTQLDLQCNRIGASGAEQLSLSMRACPALRVLKLSENEMGDAGARALAEGLPPLQKLQYLSLAATDDLSATGVGHVTAGLRLCPAFAELDLHANQVGVVLNSVGDQIEPTKGDVDAWSCFHIQRLDLSRNFCGLDLDVTAMLGEMLGRSHSLTRLNLMANKISDVGCGHLAGGLGECGALQHLEMCGNSVGDRGAAFLADVLPRCSLLSFLGLSGNEIRDAGARALSEVLAGSVSLAHIELNHNQISSQGCWRFARMLFKYQPLARLDLSENGYHADTGRIWTEVQQAGLFIDHSSKAGQDSTPDSKSMSRLKEMAMDRREGAEGSRVAVLKSLLPPHSSTMLSVGSE